MTHQRLHILAVSVCCLMVIPSAQADEKGPVFESDIQPVLARKCGKCHSDGVRKGGLDLSSIAGIRQGGESGEAAVAQTMDDSLLWTMIADRVQEILLSRNSVSVDPDAAQVDTVYELALSRLPSDIERRIGIESLNQLQIEWQGDRHAALATYCHTILNSAAFLYIN
ncbi:MAG: c-type cytochrome domain-containing protein [Planctomycetaceae bacterium]